jgi:uncharacterized membrane protein
VEILTTGRTSILNYLRLLMMFFNHKDLGKTYRVLSQTSDGGGATVHHSLHQVFAQATGKLARTGWLSSSGWWLTHPSEKYEFVNGKDYPIYFGK